MLVFDQLKKNDPQLRVLAFVVLTGLLVLFTGLWWVQLVSTRHFKVKLEDQSVRTVRIPALRGKILDRDGRVLADNHPAYNVDLYMDELSTNFQIAYSSAVNRVRSNLLVATEAQLHRKLNTRERERFGVPKAVKDQLKSESRYEVVSNLIGNLSARLQEPIDLTRKDFERHYDIARALPMQIMPYSLNQVQLARFEEQSDSEPGLDLEVQPVRYYPYGPLAAHLLGYLQHDNDSGEGERKTNYNYRLPDFIGATGIEGLFNEELHGTAGEKSVVVNYLGYRQSETVWLPAEPGLNVVLTIDLDIQKAADAALQGAQANVRGAVVVMDAQNGDVLAMASAPTYDPNHRIHPDPATMQVENERWNDEQLGLQRNRAIYQNYHPGSIFKVIVAMAGLELGTLNPDAIYKSEGFYMVGRRRIGDTAKAGDFDFDLAMAKSSNPYFINEGLKPGVLQKIIALGQRLHLGERTGIMPHQETPGNFPSLKRVSSDWRDGDTANISIGQGELDVTPVQMAVMGAAVANGGKVFWPRLVSRIETTDGAVVENYAEGRVRDYLGVSQHTLHIVHKGMLADTEDPEGTGRALSIPGWRVAGKTGTAEVENRAGHIDKSLKDTWFVSFAPEESPRYVVVATVEGGASGGLTCVPIAQKIYLALKERDAHLQSKSLPKHRSLAAVQ